MATKAKKTDALVEAFVLRECCFGSAGEVVTLSHDDAEAGEKHGMLDLNSEAIKAAKA